MIQEFIQKSWEIRKTQWSLFIEYWWVWLVFALGLILIVEIADRVIK